MIETELQKAVRESSHILYGPLDADAVAEADRIALRLGLTLDVVNHEALLGAHRLAMAEHVGKHLSELLKRLSEIKGSGSIEIDAVIDQMRRVLMSNPKSPVGLRSAASPLPIDL